MKNTIKAERSLLKVSQAELAGMVQVSRQTIYSIEQGDNYPSSVLALKLASIFSKPVRDIFTLEESDWDCD